MASRVATIMRAAVFGCLLSCASSAGFATPDGAAVGECLAKPKGTAPQGERWYYRVERNTKRHCWYTRTSTPRNVAAQTPSKPESADASDEAMNDTPPQPAPLQSSVANARAELARAPDPVAPATSFPRTVAPPAVGSALDANAANPTLAERWSDNPNPTQSNQPLSKALAQPPARAAATQAAETENTPLWILLSAIGGVLALVGIVTALIKTFAGSARYVRPDKGWADSRWDDDPVAADPRMAVVDDAPVMQMDVPPMNWIKVARETAQHHDDEIEQLLSLSARNTT